MNEVRLRPRNDMVLLREITVDKRGSLIMPQRSEQAKKRVVVAVGPKVEGLEVGDEVIGTGQQGVDWAYLPNHPDLIAVREANIILVVESSDE